MSVGAATASARDHFHGTKRFERSCITKRCARSRSMPRIGEILSDDRWWTAGAPQRWRRPAPVVGDATVDDELAFGREQDWRPGWLAQQGTPQKRLVVINGQMAQRPARPNGRTMVARLMLHSDSRTLSATASSDSAVARRIAYPIQGSADASRTGCDQTAARARYARMLAIAAHERY